MVGTMKMPLTSVSLTRAGDQEWGHTELHQEETLTRGWDQMERDRGGRC